MNSTARLLGCSALAAALAFAPQADAKRKKSGRGKAGVATRSSLPAHPSQLTFKELKYEAPNREEYLHRLSNGVEVYVVPDHALPLINIQITAKGGSYLEAEGKAGSAGATANQMRAGGAGEYSAEALDEELDFLAINLGVGSGELESSASINMLSKDLDKGLDLFFDVLREPRFDEERFELWRKQALQGLERRNDQTPAIEGREFIRTMYGPGYYRSNFRTGSSIESLTTDDLRAFHSRLWVPANLVIAVSGDVEAKDILPKLEARFQGWNKGIAVAEAPLSQHQPKPGVYVIDKDDVTQTRVSIGHRTTTWDDPDAIALEVMNDILGGSGFTSRITKRVRSDEGLAYSAGSSMGFGRGQASTFRALFQSKNKSVARGIAITLEEIDRIRKAPVSQDELETAVTAAIDSFPQRFGSASAKASSFVEDELWGRPADWWATYRDKVRALTAADLQRVAKKHLRPEDLVILVTGNMAEVIPGDPDHPEYRLETFAGEEGIQQIALPDPVTMQYPHEPRPLAEASVEGGQG